MVRTGVSVRKLAPGKTFAFRARPILLAGLAAAAVEGSPDACDYAALRRRTAATPTKPTPSRAKVEGSGTAAGVAPVTMLTPGADS